MAMKEKTFHSIKIFNFFCHIENKIVTFLQPIVKNFHLRCGLIGCMMSNQWCLTCFHLFLSWCNTLVLYTICMRCKTLKFHISLWCGEVWTFQDSVILECLFNFLIANMYYEIRNRMAMKEKTFHSIKIFNFSCHIENKIVKILQPYCKEFSPKMWSDWLYDDQINDA